MKKLMIGALAALPMTVTATDFSTKSSFLCASMEVMECVPVEGCNRVNAADVDAPRFLKVNAKKKTMSNPDAGRNSGIERVEEVDGKLILQGAEDGREDTRDGLGWTMSVDQDSGAMVLTGSGSDVAFVIFGACTAR